MREQGKEKGGRDGGESGGTVCPVVVVVTGHLRHDNPPIDLRFV